MIFRSEPFQRITRQGNLDKRKGNPGNRGGRGQIIRSATPQGYSVCECYELLFIANALAPAPFKFTDEEIAARMYELFPDRAESKLLGKPHIMRLCYNDGNMHQQRARHPEGEKMPPPPDQWSYRYIRVTPEDPMFDKRPPSRDEIEAVGGEEPPYYVYALGKRFALMYRAFPPEPEFRLRDLKHLFNIPKPDFTDFPFPGTAKAQYSKMRRERLDKERQAFQAYTRQWLSEQKRIRPQDFDPLLWKDPKW